MESKTMAGPKPSILMEQHKHTFTKSEHKIYDYILSHPDKVLYHSLTELSEYSKVAEATVLRFFRKLGFKGFQDFKFLFAQEVPQANHAPQDESFVHRIRYNIVQAIEDSSEVVDFGML